VNTCSSLTNECIKYSFIHDHAYCSLFDNTIVIKSKLPFINVFGLSTKLRKPDFISFIEKYDILCVAETKLDKFDDIYVNGYSFKGINRSGAKTKSGGVCDFVKNS
jgi:hypothetical protein